MRALTAKWAHRDQEKHVNRLHTRWPASRRWVALGVGVLLVGFTCLGFAQDVTFQSIRAAVAQAYPEVPFIGVRELDALLRRRRHETPRLLDARTAAEFAVSHLRGAERIDPDHPDVAALGADRSRTVVVYCSVGYRSGGVARTLLRAGFHDVRNLEGGIFAWANAGRAVVRGRAVVHEVHPFDDTWGRLLNADLRARHEKRTRGLHVF